MHLILMDITYADVHYIMPNDTIVAMVYSVRISHSKYWRVVRC